MQILNLEAPALVAASDEGRNIIRLPAKHSTTSKYAIIQINDQYRIKANEHGWAVEKSINRKQGEPWQAISWHGKLGVACTSLCERMVRTSGAVGIAEVLLAQESATSLISHAITGLCEVEFYSDD